MFRGMIDYLTFGYTYLCKGRGKLSAADMAKIMGGAKVVVDNAEAVLGGAATPVGAEDRADLKEAGKIYEHLEEMAVFLQSMEIV